MDGHVTPELVAEFEECGQSNSGVLALIPASVDALERKPACALAGETEMGCTVVMPQPEKVMLFKPALYKVTLVLNSPMFILELGGDWTEAACAVVLNRPPGEVRPAAGVMLMLALVH